MEKVILGNSDIGVAPLVFGGNVFGWTLDEKQSFNMLDACVDRGINMLDSADVYSAWVDGNQGGESEAVIGRWLAQSGKRDQVVIATKVGMPMPNGGSGLSRKHILKSADDSLRRLQADCIDVYYAHQDDPETPFEETLGAFQELIDAGKVRAIASSNYSAERLAEMLKFARANGLPEFIAHQPQYNLFDRGDYEGALEAVCKEFDLGVLTYFSLASGFLTGKYHSREDLQQSGRGAAFLEKYLNPRGLRILEALKEVSQLHQVPEAAIALAWILHRPGITGPIASATSTKQLDQLILAASLELPPEDMERLNSAGD
ncbi:MAG: aldo/keto reductase [Pseudomonadota bacterium]|nr:alcohol dehydrogenase [Pseudomonadales bacterium]MDY6921230.1 aldo/keto reductase [Pseudomonadota bacterium]